MASNRGVVYLGPGKVEVRSIDFPKLVDPQRAWRDRDAEFSRGNTRRAFPSYTLCKSAGASARASR